jgi:Stress up-regulated Nod 19
MPRFMRLALLACVVTAALAPASANAAITTVTRDYGPYTIPAGNGDPHDHDNMGHIDNQVVFNVQKPCSGCTLISITPDLRNSDGTRATISQGPMLHHAMFAAQGGGKTDATCAGTTVGQLGQRFFATGDERTPIDLTSVPYGYKIGSSEQWNMVYDLMNWATTSKTVRIRMTYKYATGGDATARTGVRPVWLDAAQCSLNSYISVPNGLSDTHYDWTVNVPGKIVAAAGHIHDHGVNIELTNESTGGTRICNSVAGYGGTGYVTPDGRSHVSSMTTCVGNPVATVSSGQRVRLHAIYDVPATHHPIDDAMGIALAYIAP